MLKQLFLDESYRLFQFLNLYQVSFNKNIQRKVFTHQQNDNILNVLIEKVQKLQPLPNAP